MNLEDLAYLLSAAGQNQLVRWTATPLTKQNHLMAATQLRRDVGAEKAHAVLETALLRQKAVSKFSRAHEMYFDRAGLEMSSAELISNHRAQRYAPYARVADLGCGIGGDAIGLGAHADVFGVDLDRIRGAFSAENLRTYERPYTYQHADLTTLDPLPVEALFFDPARRDERGRRIFSLRDYRPPLTLLDKWQQQTGNWGVKISPGVAYEELPESAEIEFISVKRELREAVLWYGDLRRGQARTATLLPSGATLTDAAPFDPDQPISPPRRYLYEPDPAIIRAQLVQHLAHQLDATQLDASIAYLTGDHAHDTPFATCFTVVDWFPFQLKRLRRYLRERKVGHVIIKKRGSPLEPDWLRQKLRLKGKEQRIIFLTQWENRPIIIIATSP